MGTRRLVSPAPSFPHAMEQSQRGDKTVQQIRLDEILFQGAISFEQVDGGIRPWRLPVEELSLFAPPLIEQAGQPAGVRIGFVSSTTTVVLGLVPCDDERMVDCVVDDELVETGIVAPGATEVRFEGLPEGEKRIELYLSQKAPMVVTSLAIDEGATRSLIPDDRPRWITYGSSITQAKDAASPAQTWPALVARRQKLHLTTLGYSAQCHMEPMMARMIRDLDADFISLCIGINILGGASYSARTFKWAAIGMVKIIRERHPEIPIVVQSPIFAPDREITENVVGLNLVKMREELQDAVSRLQDQGDDKLYYLDGLKIFGSEHIDYLPDRLHPNADGYRIMADNFEKYVMEEMGIAKMLRRTE